MSHEDAVVKLPKNFTAMDTKDSKLTIIENSKQKVYGVQFHPEVTIQIMENKYLKTFLFSICRIKKLEHYLPKEDLLKK